MKKILSILTVLSLMLAQTAAAVDFTCTQVYYPIYINGSLLPSDNLPILNLNGSTYVPLRKISEGSGLYVNWNNENQSVSIINSSAEIARYAALGLDLMYLFKDTYNQLLNCIESILAADEHSTAGSNLTQIGWINNSYDILNDKLQKIDKTISLIKNGSDVSYDVFLEITKCDPDAMYASLLQSRQNLEQIKNAAIGYLNGNYTYQYYSNIYNAYYDSASKGFWNSYGETVYKVLDDCYNMIKPQN